MKAQVLTDFLVECIISSEESTLTLVEEIEISCRILHLDRASNSQGCRAVLILVNPEGAVTNHALRFNFDASNNWHTSPHLDDLAKLFQTDANIKAAISRLKVCAMGRDVISIPPPPLMPLPSLLISSLNESTHNTAKKMTRFHGWDSPSQWQIAVRLHPFQAGCAATWPEWYLAGPGRLQAWLHPPPSHLVPEPAQSTAVGLKAVPKASLNFVRQYHRYWFCSNRAPKWDPRPSL